MRAEYIKGYARLWINGVPILERKIERAAPKQWWVGLTTNVTKTRFRNLRVYRPDERTIGQHGQPMAVFQPHDLAMSVLKGFPEQIRREASVSFGETPEENGIREWVKPDEQPAEAVSAPDGTPCRRLDQWGQRLRLDEPTAWGQQGMVRLEVECHGQGPGAVTVSYNTWYSEDGMTEDAFPSGNDEWQTHSFDLRDAGFRPRDPNHTNLHVLGLRAGDAPLLMRSARLVEVSYPQEAYEAVVAAYDKEIAAREGEWTVPHFLYHKALVLLRLGRHGETNEILSQLYDEYPDCECLRDYETMRAHWA
jgi:hypothetical protein